jgi:hypothetical protein
MLVLPPQTIDEKIICKLRDSSTHKLNEWRNLVAQAIGFSTYHDMMKRRAVLVDSDSIKDLLSNSSRSKLSFIMSDLSAWYVPDTFNGHLCIRKNVELNWFFGQVYDDDGRGLWEQGQLFCSLGQICVSKAVVQQFVDDLNDLVDDTDIGPEEVIRSIGAYDVVKRGSPYDFWLHSSHEERQSFLNCRTKGQFYAQVSDFIDADLEAYFASWGFSIADFVEELLADENMAFHVE